MWVLEIEALNDITKAFYTDKVGKVTDDSGVDLVFPEDIEFEQYTLGALIPLGFKARLTKESEPNTVTFPWMVAPRSSIYKTPVRQCNSFGTIDKGYRGELKAGCDILEKFKIEKGTRLFQALAPDLEPMKVRVVKAIEVNTIRGAGGFGSTGK